MSTKYLGMQFDIHGGGMDLLFPHHECEIAQNVAGYGKPSVRYWMHNNMITINGKKMGRSLGNFITLDELFLGDHSMLNQAYNPMTIRFFILQAHYRSTLDFSNEALMGSEKGLVRLMKAIDEIETIKPAPASSINVEELVASCDKAMKDDLNTPVLIAHLFEGVKWINGLSEGRQTINAADLDLLRSLYHDYVYSILGLSKCEAADQGKGITADLVEMILQLRNDAKNNRDFDSADRIRDRLSKLGITVKDRKDGADWEIN
jgi:cysteinyl-tRNA synthetase